MEKNEPRTAEKKWSLDDIKPLLEADTATVMKHFTLSGYEPYPPIAFKVAV